ncbi:hypothetical protein PIB30_068267 [Stylosanthes scabra]|uniref:Chlorophyll(Ide) b reductase NOL, chloroplastic n=1 Tax=Stylosanthes scabra TaxID=79078 RepID=A0ABU6YL03_9FABA|nr:hypothetical protein [Stylosanthes scabra]
MASTTVSSSFNFPSPTLSSHHHNHQLRLSSFPFNGFSYPTVSSRQNTCMPRGTLHCSLKIPTSCAFSAVASLNREPMVPPYNVLITGSTKGIGYALAKEFLRAGDNVVICSRSYENVETAVNNLKEEFGEHHVWGCKCDVRNAEDVKNLVSFSQEKLKYIDIWINNAGSNAYSYKPLAEASDEDLIEVVTTNTLGLMICCREAIKMMVSQPRGGHIFNIDGAGSDGRPTPRLRTDSAASSNYEKSDSDSDKGLQVLAGLVRIVGRRRNKGRRVLTLVVGVQGNGNVHGGDDLERAKMMGGVIWEFK